MRRERDNAMSPAQRIIRCSAVYCAEMLKKEYALSARGGRYARRRYICHGARCSVELRSHVARSRRSRSAMLIYAVYARRYFTRPRDA